MNPFVSAAAAGFVLAAGLAPVRGQPSSNPTAAEAAFPDPQPMAAGPFQPTWDSLAQHYRTPEWFADAKFGIWAHWGPQCQPEMGDWYARFMYQSVNDRPWGMPLEPFHVLRYGHPSKFGFKDVIRTWQAENWDPMKLMALYSRAGAQYFVALANHHDNFDLWDSKYQPWNSTRVGPHKDLIAGWAGAARAFGLRFGVSVHAARAWTWYEVAQGADKTGPYAGVPYDGRLTLADGKGQWWEGLDPQDLYAQNHPIGAPPNRAYMVKFYNRIVDLVSRYHPDLVYFDDSPLPFEGRSDIGRRIVADYYNENLAEHGGQLEAVVTGKRLNEQQRRAMVDDFERGRSPGIRPQPWQTDTCIGGWHYDRRIYEEGRYKTSVQVIQMLVDIVSKNGNLLLNIPLRGDGTPDPTEIGILEQLADWMTINREAIFATRPWRIYGEGPSTVEPSEKGPFEGIKDTGEFTAQDIRFTRPKDGHCLYAIALGWPSDGRLTIKSLAAGSPEYPGGISAVRLLGVPRPLAFTRDADGLHLALPCEQLGSCYAAAAVFKIEPAKS